MTDDRPDLADYRSLWNRLRMLVGQASNNGVSYFLISMLLVVLAAVCGRVAVTFYLAHTALVEQQLRALSGETEPRRDDRFSGISALLLGPLNLDWEARYQELERNPTYRLAKKGRERLSDLVGSISRLPPRNRKEAQATAASLLDGLNQHGDEFGQALLLEDSDRKAYCLKVLTDVVSDVRPALVVRPGTDSTSGNLRGPSGVILPRYHFESALLVPSLSLRDTTAPRGRTAVASRRLHDAIVYSRLLDLLVRPLDDAADTSAKSQAVGCFQAFFISPDNVIRFWHQGHDSRRLVDKFPNTRYWAAAKYAEHLYFSRDTTYRTRAYFDYAEGGVVLTESQLVRTADSTIVGIVATDFRIPTETVVNSVARGSILFDVRRARIPRAGLGDVRHAEVSMPERLYGGVTRKSIGTLPSLRDTVRWLPVSKEEAAICVEAVREAAAKRDFGREVVRVGPWHVEKPEQWAFVVPMGDVDGSSIDAILLFPRRLALPWEALAFGAISVFGIGGALSLFVLGFRYASRAGEVEERRALLRGLQVGFVRVNTNWRIQEANDRAEEILERRLPKPGARLQREGPEVMRLIRDEAVVERDGALVSVADFRTDVLAEITRAKRSVYYVSLRQRPWVLLRIMVTPVLGRGRAGPETAAFATFDVVPEQDAVEVREKLSISVIAIPTSADPRANANGAPAPTDGASLPAAPASVRPPGSPSPGVSTGKESAHPASTSDPSGAES